MQQSVMQQVAQPVPVQRMAPAWALVLDGSPRSEVPQMPDGVGAHDAKPWGPNEQDRDDYEDSHPNGLVSPLEPSCRRTFAAMQRTKEQSQVVCSSEAEVH